MVGDRYSSTRLHYKNIEGNTVAQNVLITQAAREYSAGKLLRVKLGELHNTTDLRIAKEHVEKPRFGSSTARR